MNATTSAIILDGLLEEYGSDDTGEAIESRDNIMQAYMEGRIDGGHPCSVCGMSHWLEEQAMDCCSPALDGYKLRCQMRESLTDGYNQRELKERALVTDDQRVAIIKMFRQYTKERGQEETVLATGMASGTLTELEKRGRSLTRLMMLRADMVGDLDAIFGGPWREVVEFEDCFRPPMPKGYVPIRSPRELAVDILRMIKDSGLSVPKFAKTVGTDKMTIYGLYKEQRISMNPELYFRLISAGLEYRNEEESCFFSKGGDNG